MQKIELIERADGKGNVQRMDYLDTDQRFYYDEFDNNVRTGKPWKPSLTHIIGEAYPTSEFLIKWRMEKGAQEAERIFKESGDIGTAVHSYINDMLRGTGEARQIRAVDLDVEYLPHQALKIKRCLMGFMNWVKDYEPKITWMEKAILAPDWAGTGDFEGTLAIDDHKSKYLIDFKTSNSIHETHSIQVAAYAKERGGIKPAILQVGNRNKSRYTFKVVDNPLYYESVFENIKETFYLITMKKGEYFCQPDIEEFPEVFSL